MSDLRCVMCASADTFVVTADPGDPDELICLDCGTVERLDLWP